MFDSLFLFTIYTSLFFHCAKEYKNTKEYTTSIYKILTIYTYITFIISNIALETYKIIDKTMVDKRIISDSTLRLLNYIPLILNRSIILYSIGYIYYIIRRSSINSVIIAYSTIRIPLIYTVVLLYNRYISLSKLMYSSILLAEDILLFIILEFSYYKDDREDNINNRISNIKDNIFIRRFLLIDNITKNIFYNIKYIYMYNILDIMVRLIEIYKIMYYGSYNYNYNTVAILDDIQLIFYILAVILVTINVRNIIKYKDNIIVDILCDKKKHIVELL